MKKVKKILIKILNKDELKGKLKLKEDISLKELNQLELALYMLKGPTEIILKNKTLKYKIKELSDDEKFLNFVYNKLNISEQEFNKVSLLVLDIHNGTLEINEKRKKIISKILNIHDINVDVEDFISISLS